MLGEKGGSLYSDAFYHRRRRSCAAGVLKVEAAEDIGVGHGGGEDL